MMVGKVEIRRDANGPIDVAYYTGRGRLLHGLAVRAALRKLASSARRRLCGLTAARPNRAVPGTIKRL